MNRDDAITIVSMIVHSWPGQDWDALTMEAYVEAIMPLDAELTTKAVARAVNQLKFRPKVAELREFVAIERRAKLSPREQADYMPVEKPPKPLWVERWERARAADDQRPFPEQSHAMAILARQSRENYRVYAPPAAPITDASVWVQPAEYLEEPSADSAIVEV